MLLDSILHHFSSRMLGLCTVTILAIIVVGSWLKPSLLSHYLHAALSRIIFVSLAFIPLFESFINPFHRYIYVGGFQLKIKLAPIRFQHVPIPGLMAKVMLVSSLRASRIVRSGARSTEKCIAYGRGCNQRCKSIKRTFHLYLPSSLFLSYPDFAKNLHIQRPYQT